MILLVPIVAGILVALLQGGSFRRLADLPLRLGWLAPLCLIVQVYVATYPADRMEADRPLQAALLMGSTTTLLLVVWVNRRIAGVPVIGLGLLLNLVVMGANGGFMPVSPEAVQAAGIHSAQQMPAVGERVPRSKDILLDTGETRLWFLSDVIFVPGVPVAKIYSVGDLIVAVGAFALFYSTMAPAGRSRARKEDNLSAI